MARPAGSLNKRTISANTTAPGEVKSFSLEHFLKKWRQEVIDREEMVTGKARSHF